MANILVVDTRLLAFETFHKKQPISHTINLIYEYTKDFVIPNKIVFAWDSPKGSVRRKEMYKEYKAHRKEKYKTQAEKQKIDNFNKKFKQMEPIFAKLGNLVHLDGYEADDIANIIVDHLSSQHYIYLLSSDKDWAANIINSNVKQIHLRKGLIDLRNIKEKVGYNADEILFVQALCGVTKENIKGVYKLGDVRIKNYLKEYSKDDILKIIQECVDTGKHGMKLPANFKSVDEMFEFNYELLRKITIDDLTEKEKKLFKEQFNKKLGYSAEEIEQNILFTLNEPFIFNYELKKFYKLK